MSDVPDNVKGEINAAINDSGYPLELAIARAVEVAPRRRATVVAREYPYKDSSGNSRFADLVISCAWYRLVVECKRIHPARMIFLTPIPRWTESGAGTIRVSTVDLSGARETGVSERILPQRAYVSSMCVVQQKQGGRRLLEDSCRPLIEATDAYADLELTSLKWVAPWANDPNGGFHYVPVIVTTAELFVSAINPEEIDLEKGTTLPVEHESVPWVRFKKTFDAPAGLPPADEPISEFLSRLERTVYVVHALRFSDFLERLGA